MKSSTDSSQQKIEGSSCEMKQGLRFSAITLFPEMFDAVINYGVIGRAIKRKLIHLDCINPREFTNDRHRTVDDRPYGGGPGMLMKVEPLEKAINQAKANYACAKDDVNVIYLSPQGKRIDHQMVKRLSKKKHLVLLSGRYEGVDQRLIDHEVDEEISIGDIVLSGGELAAMVLIDSITRLLPGTLGHEQSAIEDSFEDGLLDHPHYTRPENYLGVTVPQVLLGGNHQQIESWRLKQRLGKTWLNRPDLLNEKKLSAREQSLLADFKKENEQ